MYVKIQRAARVKGLLDEAISEGIATDAAGRNTLVKVKNSVLKIVKRPDTGSSSGSMATKGVKGGGR